MIQKSRFLKLMAVLTVVFFISSTISPVSLAQSLPGVAGLPAPGQMILASQQFVPVMLRGIQLQPDKPLEFGFLIDSGNTGLAGDALKQQTEQLVKYFLTALTVPDEHLWVNLSPGEDNRVIPEDFGITAMGRDLLAQDYILKQLTASLIHPDQELGKEFWKRVSDKVREQFNGADIPTDAFSRVWVVPDKALVLENNGTAFIAESRLKVLLEEDYHAMHDNLLQADTGHQTQDTGNKERLVSCVRCQVSRSPTPPCCPAGRNVLRTGSAPLCPGLMYSLIFSKRKLPG